MAKAAVKKTEKKAVPPDEGTYIVMERYGDSPEGWSFWDGRYVSVSEAKEAVEKDGEEDTPYEIYRISCVAKSTVAKRLWE